MNDEVAARGGSSLILSPYITPLPKGTQKGTQRERISPVRSRHPPPPSLLVTARSQSPGRQTGLLAAVKRSRRNAQDKNITRISAPDSSGIHVFDRAEPPPVNVSIVLLIITCPKFSPRTENQEIKLPLEENRTFNRRLPERSDGLSVSLLYRTYIIQRGRTDHDRDAASRPRRPNCLPGKRRSAAITASRRRPCHLTQ